MYLYFYVGNFTKSAEAQTAGLKAELLNGKQDVCIHIIDTYVNGTSWYRIWSDGWIEQGGNSLANANTVNITLLKSFTNTNYSIIGSISGANRTLNIPSAASTKLLNSFQFYVDSIGGEVYWEACGY